MTAVLADARVVVPGGVLDRGHVVVAGDRIASVAAGPAPESAAAVVTLDGAWLLPGFVDLHVHGGGGHDAAASPEDAAGAAAFHLRHGTTSTLISLVTAPVDALKSRLRWIARLADDPASTVVGAHLEGPFLSPARRGAQNPAHLLLPHHAVFAQLVEAAAGRMRSVTLAPELPGAVDLVGAAVAAGAVAAIGHSDATYAQAAAAIDAGATLATHLFNGMRPLHHREPGIAGAALRAGITCELINDGVHVHPALVGLLMQRPERLALITDAIDAAGVGDGRYRLGGHDVEVRDGQARLADGALAGSTLTLDDAVRRAVRECGVPIEAAAECAATTPARVLGLGDRGSIAAGQLADLVVLDDDLRPLRVMRAGRWCDA